MKKNLSSLLLIVGLIAYIFSVPYAIALGGKYGAFKTADYDGTEVVEIVPKGLPCKYGEGVAYVHTDISMKYYPLTIWCPRGYYSFNLRVVFNSDQMIGKITDNVLNGEPRSNVLKVVIRDDHKELKGKVIATTWANEEGYFYFDPSLVIPSSAWFDNSIQGKLVIEIDGQSSFGFSTYTYNKQLVLKDFKECLLENGYIDYHMFDWSTD